MLSSTIYFQASDFLAEEWFEKLGMGVHMIVAVVQDVTTGHV